MKLDCRAHFLSLLVVLPSLVRGFSVSVSTPNNMASTTSSKAACSSTNVPGKLVEHAVAWASANGLSMVVREESGLFTSTHLPFSLLPYGAFIFFVRSGSWDNVTGSLLL